MVVSSWKTPLLFPDYETIPFKTLHTTRATEREGHVVHHQPVKKLPQDAEVQSLYELVHLVLLKRIDLGYFPLALLDSLVLSSSVALTLAVIFSSW